MTTSSNLPVWAIDSAHSSIGFTVRHMVVSRVRGRFTRWNGTIAMDERDPTGARVEISIEPASVDTGVEQRDNHLRSPDFFDVERHAAMTFRSTAIQKTGEGRYRVTGDLAMHGVTRPVSLEVEFAGSARDPWGGIRAGFSARGSLDRRDFGLTYNQLLEAGGVLVGEKVDLDIEVEAVKRSTAPAAAAA